MALQGYGSDPCPAGLDHRTGAHVRGSEFDGVPALEGERGALVHRLPVHKGAVHRDPPGLAGVVFEGDADLKVVEVDGGHHEQVVKLPDGAVHVLRKPRPQHQLPLLLHEGHPEESLDGFGTLLGNPGFDLDVHGVVHLALEAFAVEELEGGVAAQHAEDLGAVLLAVVLVADRDLQPGGKAQRLSRLRHVKDVTQEDFRREFGLAAGQQPDGQQDRKELEKGGCCLESSGRVRRTQEKT